jgi:Domain of unknown function (DUF4780)
VKEDTLPKEHIITGYFLSSVDKPSDQILRIIQGQNEALLTGNWKVLNRSE